MSIKEISMTVLTPANAVTPKAPSSLQKGGFETYLKQALGEVNQLQHQADRAIQQLVSGENGDLQNTIVALEKADLSFRLMMQIRNKVLEAYQEIVRMQV